MEKEQPKKRVRGRVTRIVMGSLLPTIFAVVYLMVWSLELPPIKELAVVLLFGYMFTGVQAIVASLVMEFVVNPRWGYPVAIVVGGVLGLIGIAIFALEAELLIMGTVIGTLMGWLLHFHYRRSTVLERQGV